MRSRVDGQVINLSSYRKKILVIAGLPGGDGEVLNALKSLGDVVLAGSVDQAVKFLQDGQAFDGVFSSAGPDFLHLERALVSQQANQILNTLGEGVCIVDSEGRCNWMNKKMQAWPPRVHEMVRRSCKEAFELFSRQTSPQTAESPVFSRSKRYSLNIEDQQFMEMIASPVISPSGFVVQVVAVVWDATGTRRLQQKIDAIDKAGRSWKTRSSVTPAT
jgi:transcriptional regulator with PAS, ATPase and Fis domain